MKRCFIILSAFLLISCNDFSVPKCDDPEVTEGVLSLVNEEIVSDILVESDVKAVMTTSQDKELKSCDCEMTINKTARGKQGSPLEGEFENIDYTVQRNSKGELVYSIISY